MSRLTDKYQSYAHYKGISFDEQTFTSTPTRTGALQYLGNTVSMANGIFSNDGTNSPTIQTGVLPNQKYYQFEYDSTTTPAKSARIIFGSTNSSNAGGIDDVRRLFWDNAPFDRVCGFWMKMPSQFGIDNANTNVHRLLYGNLGIVSIGPGKSNGAPAIVIIHGNSELPTASINLYTNYTDSGGNVVPIEWNKWYFIAYRKTVVETNNPSVNTTATGTLEYKHYINGNLRNTVSVSTWTKRSVNAITFGNTPTGAPIGNVKIGLSSWFVTDWNQVDIGGLADIFRYGSPFYSPMKYYDGDSWEWVNGQKVYYNNAWQDVYADRFDGTNWVPM